MSEDEKLEADLFYHTTLNDMFRSGNAKKMGGNAYMLYGALKAYCDLKTGHLSIPYEVITEVTGFSSATIAKHLRTLADLGYLSVTKQGKRSHYSLLEQTQVRKAGSEEVQTASIDYIPTQMAESMRQLRDMLQSGVLKDTKHIQFNIALQTGAQPINNNIVFSSTPMSNAQFAKQYSTQVKALRLKGTINSKAEAELLAMAREWEETDDKAK